MREVWARPIAGWCLQREDGKFQWKERYAHLKQGVLTLHTDSFEKASSAAASVPRLVLNLVGTQCGVYNLAAGDNEATMSRWERHMQPEACFVIKVPNQRTVYLYFTDTKQVDSWSRVLRACAKARLPSRKVAREAPSRMDAGFSASVASARDIGSDVLYKTYVAHWNPATGYERVTNILTYDDLRDMQTELTLLLPGIAIPPLPTSRVFRNKDHASIEQRVVELDTYMQRLFSSGQQVLTSEPVRRTFHIRHLLESARSGHTHLPPSEKRASIAIPKTQTQQQTPSSLPSSPATQRRGGAVKTRKKKTAARKKKKKTAASSTTAGRKTNKSPAKDRRERKTVGGGGGGASRVPRSPKSRTPTTARSSGTSSPHTRRGPTASATGSDGGVSSDEEGHVEEAERGHGPGEGHFEEDVDHGSEAPAAEGDAGEEDEDVAAMMEGIRALSAELSGKGAKQGQEEEQEQERGEGETSTEKERRAEGAEEQEEEGVTEETTKKGREGEEQQPQAGEENQTAGGGDDDDDDDDDNDVAAVVEQQEPSTKNATALTTTEQPEATAAAAATVAGEEEDGRQAAAEVHPGAEGGDPADAEKKGADTEGGDPTDAEKKGAEAKEEEEAEKRRAEEEEEAADVEPEADGDATAHSDDRREKGKEATTDGHEREREQQPVTAPAVPDVVRVGGTTTTTTTTTTTKTTQKADEALQAPSVPHANEEQEKQHQVTGAGVEGGVEAEQQAVSAVEEHQEQRKEAEEDVPEKVEAGEAEEDVARAEQVDKGEESASAEVGEPTEAQLPREEEKQEEEEEEEQNPEARGEDVGGKEDARNAQEEGGDILGDIDFDDVDLELPDEPTASEAAEMKDRAEQEHQREDAVDATAQHHQHQQQGKEEEEEEEKQAETLPVGPSRDGAEAVASGSSKAPVPSEAVATATATAAPSVNAEVEEGKKQQQKEQKRTGEEETQASAAAAEREQHEGEMLDVRKENEDGEKGHDARVVAEHRAADEETATVSAAEDLDQRDLPLPPLPTRTSQAAAGAAVNANDVAETEGRQEHAQRHEERDGQREVADTVERADEGIKRGAATTKASEASAPKVSVPSQPKRRVADDSIDLGDLGDLDDLDELEFEDDEDEPAEDDEAAAPEGGEKKTEEGRAEQGNDEGQTVSKEKEEEEEEGEQQQQQQEEEGEGEQGGESKERHKAEAAAVTTVSKDGKTEEQKEGVEQRVREGAGAKTVALPTREERTTELAATATPATTAATPAAPAAPATTPAVKQGEAATAAVSQPQSMATPAANTSAGVAAPTASATVAGERQPEAEPVYETIDECRRPAVVVTEESVYGETGEAEDEMAAVQASLRKQLMMGDGSHGGDARQQQQQQQHQEEGGKGEKQGEEQREAGGGAASSFGDDTAKAAVPSAPVAAEAATKEGKQTTSQPLDITNAAKQGTSPLSPASLTASNGTAAVVETQEVDKSSVGVRTPRSARRWFGGLFSKSTIRRKKQQSPGVKRRSLHTTPAKGSDFLEQAKQFESQVKASGSRMGDDEEDDDGQQDGREFHIYDDPRQIMVQMFKKSKHDKKTAAAFNVALNHTLAQTTHPFTHEGELVVKQELDSAGHKAKSHTRFKTYIASLRGCALTLRSSEKDRLPTIGPLYITSDGVSREAHKKRGAVIRVSAVQGTFLMQGKDGAQTAAWYNHLTSLTPLVLDCPHYISSEAKDALEAFVAKTVNLIPSGDAARLPVVMLGLSGSGKTSIIRSLTSQGSGVLSTQPTDGFRKIDLVWSPNVVFQVTDVGGSNPETWHTHLSPPPFAVVFVVDSVNPRDFDDAKTWIHHFLQTSSLRHTMFIIALNKQGYNEKSVVEPHELCTRLELVHQPFAPLVAVMSCNARLGAGVLDIFNVLAGNLPWSEG